MSPTSRGLGGHDPQSDDAGELLLPAIEGDEVAQPKYLGPWPMQDIEPTAAHVGG